MNAVYAISLALMLGGCVSASDVIPLVSEHVLFGVTASVLYACGRLFKAILPAATAGTFWRVCRQTLPLHPVLAGALLGLAFPALVPSSVGSGRIACALYFAGSGVLATYGRDLFRTWAKYRAA